MASHDVAPLQVALNAQGEALTVDGEFGTDTQQAMKRYEKAHGLTVSYQPTREVCTSLGIDLGPDFLYQPIAPVHKPNPLETAIMNFSWLTIILNFLPTIQALEQDVEQEVKILNSTEEGKVKLTQTIAVLEDVLKRVKAALGITT